MKDLCVDLRAGERAGDGVPGELLPRYPAEGAAGREAGPGRGQNTGGHTTKKPRGLGCRLNRSEVRRITLQKHASSSGRVCCFQ